MPPKSALRKSDRTVTAFVATLFEMLDNRAAWISWSATNDSFIITDPEKFASDTLPTYYKTSKWNSFSRQLSSYGFERGFNADKNLELRHLYFIRGHKELLCKIKRAEGRQAVQFEDDRPKQDQVIRRKRLIAQTNRKIKEQALLLENLQASLDTAVRSNQEQYFLASSTISQLQAENAELKERLAAALNPGQGITSISIVKPSLVVALKPDGDGTAMICEALDESICFSF